MLDESLVKSLVMTARGVTTFPPCYFFKCYRPAPNGGIHVSPAESKGPTTSYYVILHNGMCIIFRLLVGCAVAYVIYLLESDKPRRKDAA